MEAANGGARLKTPLQIRTANSSAHQAGISALHRLEMYAGIKQCGSVSISLVSRAMTRVEALIAMDANSRPLWLSLFRCTVLVASMPLGVAASCLPGATTYHGADACFT